ncbi:RNA-directed DNA polymerase, eukaryota, reverse transcriptase zinc-binding domain protein [Tanacetum coccineum]
MGDFNVTLKPEEHSDSKSGINYDMQEFYDTVNGLEVDDLCSSSFHFTWTKSLKNPENSILKKLDRMTINEEFILQYSKANEIFLPFLVSDHTLSPFAKFLCILKTRKHKSIVESICDEKGSRYWGDDVAKQIVNHFHEFLGVARPVRTLDQLGDIVQLKLSKEDANAMIMEMTDKEIKEATFDIDFSKAFFKEAMFDMDFAKASGPDGYTSCFFKKSWEVIGKDVCMSIREFFTKGKLLREVNSTLIALVPKVDTPNKISDFRPIACCNVIYKCINKILTNRIMTGLHKVVSINQSAFILGRHIQDNILLTKSTIFFGSIMENQKQELLEIMPFKCGKFPMKYLGVPLLAKRLGVSDCIDLIDSVARRINSWRNKMLSYAGRIQLIESILSYMQNYWASVYMLPVTIVKEFDKLFKREKVKPFVSYKVGNGKDISVWHDKWCQLGPLDKLFSKSDLYDAKLDDDAKIADMIHNGRWKWPIEWIEDHPDLLLILVYCLNEHIKDKTYWVDEEDVENKLKSLSVRDSVVIDVANVWGLTWSNKKFVKKT